MSVNVGMPTNIDWNGRTVRTGIWKRPIGGPVMARRLNLDGDGQGDAAGHGGEQRAVMAYQIESYRHWEQHLGLAPLDMGSFGENLTVTGMADDSVCIGDRYRVGEALFEVTQPRVTCFRVGIRLGLPQMPSLLVSHRRPGFYMRVLEEGHVQAEDSIELVSRGPHELTVAEIDGLLYLPAPNMARVRAAADISALSPGWQGSFADMIRSHELGAAAATVQIGTEPGWQGFRPLRVARLDRETDDVLSIHLEAPDRAPLPPPLPGQHLTLQIPSDAKPGPLRSYSISSAPAVSDYRISVKREASGLASRWLHSELRLGDSLMVAAPRGAFTLDPRATNPVVLVSAGIGITPMLAMLHALSAANSPRSVWWLHTTRDLAHHAFTSEVASLLAELPNARSRVYYTRVTGAAAAAAAAAATIIAGRLDQAALERLELPHDATVYVCGPQAFMDAVATACRTLGITDVRSELFGTLAAVNPGIVDGATHHPHRPNGPPGPGPEVTFARSGITALWSPEEYSSLLELAEACDVPTRWSCRTGVCHMCATLTLTGRAVYFNQPLVPPDGGEILLCSSRPADNLILDM